MPEWLQILMTAAVTLLGGIVLLVTSEFIKLLVITPLKQYRDHVQFILDRLDFHAGYVTNFFSEEPSEEERELMRQISKDFRTAATKLNAVYAGVTLKKTLEKWKLLPKRDDINNAYGKLLLLSNNLPRASRSTHGRDPILTNHEAMEDIKKLLRTRGH